LSGFNGVFRALLVAAFLFAAGLLAKVGLEAFRVFFRLFFGFMVEVEAGGPVAAAEQPGAGRGWLAIEETDAGQPEGEGGPAWPDLNQ
jgi:hypothetical protein